MLRHMLLLSRVTGQRVLTGAGLPVGRLADLTVELDGGGNAPLVERLVLRQAGGHPAMLPWSAVERFHPGRVVLAGEPAVEAFAGAELAAAEIMLKRDVLDTQIVDVVGQRLARVADVLLTRTPGGRLELIGVEVGFTGVLRRLGLPRIPGGQDMVAWTDLHLTSERGHAVQLSTPRAAVHRLDARGLAALVSRLDTDSATEVLAAKSPEVAAGAVRAVHPEVGERMLRAMPRQQAETIVGSMPAEHAGRWRQRLRSRPPWLGRRLLRSGAWPRRRHLIRDRRS